MVRGMGFPLLRSQKIIVTPLFIFSQAIFSLHVLSTDLRHYRQPRSRRVISLDQGRGYADGTRHMGNSGRSISYGLYQNPDHSVPWGDGPRAEAGIGDGTGQALTVYGRILAQPTSTCTGNQDHVG